MSRPRGTGSLACPSSSRTGKAACPTTYQPLNSTVRRYNSHGRGEHLSRSATMTNETIAQRLADHSRQLEAEGSNVFRARAFRRAAEVVRDLPRQVADVVAQEGRAGLEALPG